MGNVQGAINSLKQHEILVLTDCNYDHNNAGYDAGKSAAKFAKLGEGSHLLHNLEAASIPNDSINYIALGAKTVVTLYEDDKFEGRAVTLTNNTDNIKQFNCSNLRDLGMNGNISSMVVVGLKY